MEVVTGIFKARDDAERAVSQLRTLGIQDKQIGILAPGNVPAGTIEKGVTVTDTEEPGIGRAMGAAVGGAMGAAGGATLGAAVATLAIPGIGPVVAVGMVGAALLGMVGAAAGSAVGDTIEEELGEGMSREDVYLYEDALFHGNTVVMAYAEEGEQADRAREMINDAGAKDIETVRERWWEELREGERTHYKGDFDRDEGSYRRGYVAALHPELRGKQYKEAEEEIRSAYAGTVLDRPFQDGYERGRNYRPKVVEKPKG